METTANLFSNCIYLSNVQKRSVTRHEILIGSCSGKSLLIMAFRHNPWYNYVGSISSSISKAKNPTKLITANPSPSSPPFESRCVTPSAFLSSRQHPCGVVQGSIWRSFLERSGKSGFGGLEAVVSFFFRSFGIHLQIMCKIYGNVNSSGVFYQHIKSIVRGFFVSLTY